MIDKLTSEEIRSYQQWEEKAALKTGRTRYLDYVPSMPVFSIRNDDILLLADGISISLVQGDELEVICQHQESDRRRTRISLPGEFSEKNVVDILSTVNGERSVEEIIRLQADKYKTIYVLRLFGLLVGHAVLLPETVNFLNNIININEIVRIPLRSPYSLLREYWENQGSIRQYLSELPGSLDTLYTFRSYLSDLHIIATIGLSRTNYYGGGGGVETTPGEYRISAIETSVSDNMVEFLSRELKGMGFNYPIRIDKTLKSDRDRIVGYSFNSALQHHHYYDGAADMDGKLDELREYLVLIEAKFASGEVDDALRHISYFHWLFTHLHPFTNINNSIAMNIVNNYLKSMKIGYIPHLFLDYFAQRTSRQLYEKVFMNYINKFSFPDGDEAGKEKLRIVGNYYRRFKSLGNGLA